MEFRFYGNKGRGGLRKRVIICLPLRVYKAWSQECLTLEFPNSSASENHPGVVAGKNANTQAETQTKDMSPV